MTPYSVEWLSGPALVESGWIDAILALERENLAPLLAATGQSFPEARRRAGLSTADAAVVLLLRDGVLVGCIDFVRDWNDPADLYVASVQLKAAARGGPALGILLAGAFEAVARMAWRRLTANVHPSNHPALRLAGRLGFRRTAAPGRSSVGLALDREALLASPFAALAATLAARHHLGESRSGG
ncbi:MAG TPA: GNAT family N-acetyltransferase [Longimicrobium sp.]|jgi:L-amino acid N-acyltransferase YncA|nr:GNAT family N-acetyltransferase [Longimicrobium sp.]